VSLNEYRKKRNFGSTTEPKASRSPAKTKKLTFVVQRHDATRLHYDFRLEMEGVLRSWAVPKGPSMVPGEKRLAVLVEDHPIEYGKFYGVIPEGNYGAGTVEVWDKGIYAPESEKGGTEQNLLKMLREGDIKFVLNGTYLKGRFALFRLDNPEKPNEWMLVKKNDEYAADTFDTESLPPLKSKHKLKTRNSGSGRAIEPFPDPLPEPMLAKLSLAVPDKTSWIYETKLDGYRIMCSVNGGRVNLVSRNGINYNRKFELLVEDLGRIEESLILDGEAVVEDTKGRSEFSLLQEYFSTGKRDLKYCVFDILYLNGHNIMGFPLRKRKELLESFFKKYSFTRVMNLPHQKGKGRELFEQLSGEGYEGIIAKDPESTYMPGKRSEAWLKVKSVRTQEAVICGYTEPQGSRKYFGSIILGVYEEHSLKYIGNCGTGFSDSSLGELYSRFKSLTTKSCPFDSVPILTGTKGKPVWLRPELVASIKFMEWTRDDILRHPVFLGLREDKSSGEVINETKIAAVAERSTEKTQSGRETTLELSGKKVKLTNLTKVYWTDEGYTKGELITYYESISKYILPYLKDRPQSLNRHPGGINGQSFYQKDIDTRLAPGWIRTVKKDSTSHPEGIDYLICNDLATLIYMVNLGCIEINPWHSTYRKPDHPTYIILDLDPGDISFIEVINTALVIKDICDEIRIPCYPKTSGATGMHIYIPLGNKYDYDQARTFSEIIAVLAHNRLPSTTSIERPVSKRNDKVYIDYLQNRKGQTIAAPYSVRPRPLATVSAPLGWKEVNNHLTPEMFTMKNMVRRLQKRGDLWQPVLKTQISLVRALKAIEKIS
jgi:bifunctional non-homologous end joining protein LigD